ncbi:Serine threonine- kinase CTR1 [Chlorella sorokiniana]|uniref:Serine threonine-kinase CTR1 n=1 Tax=Chlorella sorokiniana TaxID=3076 RepID=A0A2P6TW25_CHLSO|nr:Serine threonine- kinase CTR1 [Chlorella sorokiniana]|eukprot:PRW58265.1 Serine threonine- kinase CTR1 [Chlorella sorokiniana]
MACPGPSPSSSVAGSSPAASDAPSTAGDGGGDGGSGSGSANSTPSADGDGSGSSGNNSTAAVEAADQSGAAIATGNDTAPEGGGDWVPPPSPAPPDGSNQTYDAGSSDWWAQRQWWKTQQADSGPNVGAIVGGAVAGAAAIAACATGFLLMRRRRRQRRLLAAAGAVDAPPSPDLEAGKGGPSHSCGSSGSLQAAGSGSRSGPSGGGPSDSDPDSPTGDPDGVQELAELWAAAARAAGQGQAGQPGGMKLMHLTGSSPEGRNTPDLLLSWAATRAREDELAAPEASGSAGSSSAEASSVAPGQSAAGPSREGDASGTAAGALASTSQQAVAAQAQASREALDQRSRSHATKAFLSPWELKFSALQFVRPLGSGSYGQVYLATLQETPCAVKLLTGCDEAAAVRSGDSSLSLSMPVMQALQREASTMAALRHPNIVLFLGLTYSPPAIITEYCSRGSLFDCLRAAAQSPSAAAGLTWTRRLNMALDAAKGMLCLHSQHILHRDLKSPNLLVDAGWRVKLCDFNLSSLLDATRSHSSSVGGGMLNPRWLAPEVLAGGAATAASDTFAFGVVMWELLTWRTPWEREGKNPFQLVFMITSGERLPVPALPDLPGPPPPAPLYDAYVALMRRCWAQDAADRPSFSEVIVELRSILGRHASSRALLPPDGSGSGAAGGGAAGPPPLPEA